MKKLTFLSIFLFLSFSQLTIAQEEKVEFEKLVSSIFFGFDFNSEPVLEDEARPPIYASGEIKEEKNRKLFKNHPFIKSQFVWGTYNSLYLHDKKYYESNGMYNLKIRLVYTDEKECYNEYNNIINAFRAL